MARPTGRDIRGEVIQNARDAIQSKGINGFSFGELAVSVGVKTPSIHHHFKRKSDLIGDVTGQYRSDFRAAVDEFDAASAVERLDAYFELFLTPAAAELMCLCGAVAAGWPDAGDAARDEVAGFFRDEIAWVTDQLNSGVASGELRGDIDAAKLASAIIATLEGQFLLVRAGIKEAVDTNGAKTILDLAVATG